MSETCFVFFFCSIVFLTPFFSSVSSRHPPVHCTHQSYLLFHYFLNTFHFHRIKLMFLASLACFLFFMSNKWVFFYANYWLPHLLLLNNNIFISWILLHQSVFANFKDYWIIFLEGIQKRSYIEFCAWIGTRLCMKVNVFTVHFEILRN